jgi:ubiquitin C-terminal hydrolase
VIACEQYSIFRTYDQEWHTIVANKLLIYSHTFGLCFVFFSQIFSSVDKDKSLYHLAGVVEHRGPSMNAGHYVAYVRARRLGNQEQQSSCSSSWFCADDGHIREVTLEEVLKREAYILFYEKMEG